MKAKYRRLSELGTIVTGATPPKTHPEWYAKTGMPFLTPSDMAPRTRRIRTSRFLSTEGVEGLVSRTLPSGTTAIVCIGSLGKICQVNEPTISNQQINSFTPFESELDATFAYYALIEIAEYLPQIATGSTLPIVNGTLFGAQKIRVPSLNEQRAIAATLGALDDKIESNTRIRQYSLELCRSRFFQLFGNFGSGNSAQEFITLNDVGNIVGGGTPSKKEPTYYTDEGIGWLTPKDLSKSSNMFQQHGEIDITPIGLAKSSAQLLPSGTVLFTSRAPIGYLAIALGETTTNQGFKSIVPNREYGTPFTFFLIEQLTPIIQAHAGGSTFKEISKTGLGRIILTKPKLDQVAEFNQFAEAYLERIESTEREFNQLVQLRDVLLPELLSGRIRVRDAKDTVQDAVDSELPEVNHE